jgi:hypothetical protein
MVWLFDDMESRVEGYRHLANTGWKLVSGKYGGVLLLVSA